jgi:hypothetical protein
VRVGTDEIAGSVRYYVCSTCVNWVKHVLGFGMVRRGLGVIRGKGCNRQCVPARARFSSTSQLHCKAASSWLWVAGSAHWGHIFFALRQPSSKVLLHD